jgi:ferrous iron transport protein B
VVVFLPHILVLFLGISLLEDTGYMARAAFLMDRLMHAVGLHGKSFIPLLLGFGCNVPAIMAARTLESRRDRLITILINPFMSCSARLPVYILVAGAFFGSAAGNVIFVLYALGIVVAIGVGRLLASFVFGGRSAPFVMELPPYRTPTLRGTLLHMWDRAWVYLRKMGTLVLAFSIVVWFFSTFPRSGDGAETATAQEQTYLGRFGHAIAPVMEPLGFGWKETVALGTGVVAKEIVVSTMAVLYAGGDEEALPDELLVSGLTPLSAFAFLVFVLLYTPCLVTVVAVKREAGGWRWAALSVFGQMLIAWTFAFTVVQGGRLMGLGP